MRKRNISLAAENRQVNERMASLDAQLEIYIQSEAEVSQMLRQEQNKVIGKFTNLRVVVDNNSFLGHFLLKFHTPERHLAYIILRTLNQNVVIF